MWYQILNVQPSKMKLVYEFHFRSLNIKEFVAVFPILVMLLSNHLN